MIDAGYAVMRVAPNPFRAKAPGVVDICSVSDCISHRPDNWINAWLHNGRTLHTVNPIRLSSKPWVIK